MMLDKKVGTEEEKYRLLAFMAQAQYLGRYGSWVYQEFYSYEGYLLSETLKPLRPKVSIKSEDYQSLNLKHSNTKQYMESLYQYLGIKPVEAEVLYLVFKHYKKKTVKELKHDIQTSTPWRVVYWFNNFRSDNLYYTVDAVEYAKLCRSYYSKAENKILTAEEVKRYAEEKAKDDTQIYVILLDKLFNTEEGRKLLSQPINISQYKI